MRSSQWLGLVLLALCAVMILFVLVPAATAQGIKVPPSIEFKQAPDLWFVELNSPPAIEAGNLSKAYINSLKNEKASFRSAAKAARITFVERYAYHKLWNGLAIKAGAKYIQRVAGLRGVRAVYPVGITEAPEKPDHIGSVANPNLFTSVPMTGAPEVWNLGFTGKGVKVAVMDTGVDYNHPDLGGCFGPGCRVAGGWDLVGDAYDAVTNPNPIPDPDPMDCAGHGTHVSGIIGANGLVKGMAPDVTLRMYRVFGCAGSTSDDVMLAAMEMILADGNQVLNMSIGSAFADWREYPTARGSDNLVTAGIVVAASAGNSGANGLWSSGAPSTGRGVISVASVDNVGLFADAFSLPDNSLMGYLPLTFSDPFPTGTFAVTDVGKACSSLTVDLTGQIALIVRGTCTFATKAANAKAAGAAGALIFNNSAGVPNFTLGSPMGFAVGGMLQSDGLALQAKLPVSITFNNQTTSIHNPTGGLISSFSSFGPTAELGLKPNISAPGGSIFSTYPLALGGYATLSGTSMASPHIAGAAALALQANPHAGPSWVKSRLQNNAVPALWWGNPALGLLDNVHRQGAGLVNINAAVNNKVVIQPSELALGPVGYGNTVTQNITIFNGDKAAKTYTLSHAPALATGWTDTATTDTFVPNYWLNSALVGFESDTVFVPAGGKVTVGVSIQAPNGVFDSVFGGYLVATPGSAVAAATADTTLQVPYVGFAGDYRTITVFNPAASSYGNPILSADGNFGPSAPITVSRASGAPAFVLFHLDHPVRRLRMFAYNAHSGKPWSEVFTDNFDPRNSTATGFYLAGWFLTDMAGHPAPNGQYFLRMEVQKALGDPNDPAAWETWDSPVVTVVP